MTRAALYTTKSRMITVTQAETPEDLDAVRDLVRAFVRWAMIKIENPDNPEVLAGLEVELADLQGRYGPPSGCIALARLDGAPAGCVAFAADPAYFHPKHPKGTIHARPQASRRTPPGKGTSA